MNVRAGFLLATGIAVFLLTACGDGDSPSLLARRVEASFEVTAKVTYEVTFDPQGTGKTEPVSTTITQGRWGRRMDSFKSRENMTFSGSFLDLGDAQYMCNRYTGVEVEGPLTPTEEQQLKAFEDGVCYDSKSLFDDADEFFGPIFDFTFSFRETLMDLDEEVEWRTAPARTIAGLSADCYQVTFTDPETDERVSTDICFSDDDILLSMDLRSPDASGILALEVDRDVREDDFALPYPVVDWPY